MILANRKTFLLRVSDEYEPILATIPGIRMRLATENTVVVYGDIGSDGSIYVNDKALKRFEKFVSEVAALLLLPVVWE